MRRGSSNGRARRRRGLLVAVALAALVVSVVAAGASQLARSSETSYQRSLRTAVEGAGALPRTAHDPARQSQVSLATAAAGRNGPGTRVKTLARGVVLRKLRRGPARTDSKRTGVISGG
jgi:hypothetical protein